MGLGLDAAEAPAENLEVWVSSASVARPSMGVRASVFPELTLHGTSKTGHMCLLDSASGPGKGYAFVFGTVP